MCDNMQQLILLLIGHTLITDKKNNYFRLQINNLHCIESITCLSKKPFSCESFTQLYGKHEAYFNNLIARYNMNLIDDFIDFFTKPCTAALYQEPFCNLLEDIYEQGGNMVFHEVKTKYNEFYEGKRPESDLNLFALKNESTCKECGQSEVLRHDAECFWSAVGGERIVFKNLTGYLRKYAIANPQYAVPDVQFI